MALNTSAVLKSQLELRKEALSAQTKSKAELFAALPKEEQDVFLSSLSKHEAEALNYDWDFWSRPKQRLPQWSWYCWLIMAGRGFGKTKTGAETIRQWKEVGYSDFALIGQTSADVRDVMLHGESGLITISPPWDKPKHIESKRIVVWPNGARAFLYSADKPDQLRGPQHQKGWLDEPVKFQKLRDLLDMFELGLRIGKNPQYVVTTTPKPLAELKELAADPLTHITTGSSYENITNLAPQYINRIIKKYEGTRIGRQELYAELFTDVAGALWNYELIDKYRVKSHPDLIRIVVSLDPAVTSNERSDEVGIVVAGLGGDGHIYILEDASLKASPMIWSAVALNKYISYKADVIIGETNNGGDLVETVIGTHGHNANFKKLHASRGKYTRAEPVSALYDQGKVHHVGELPALETEMIEWVPGGPSPNRLDAMVWACTELLIDDGSAPGEIIPIDRFM